MIPFEPETEEALANRYPEAIAEAINVEDIKAGKRETPGKERRHVFDFYDGLRLIISRETNGEVEFVHFSASMNPVNPFNEDGKVDYIKFVVGHIMGLNGKPLDGTMSVSFAPGKRGDILHIIFHEGFQMKPPPDARQMPFNPWLN